MTPPRANHRLIPWLMVLLCALSTPDSRAQSAPPAPFGDPQLVALLQDRDLDEISGLAASRRSPGIYWLHNDAPREALLHAVDAMGKRHGSLRIQGAKAIDWEDISSYTLDGKHWLLIGDVGDNGGVRKDYELVAIEEPALPAAGQILDVKPAWRLRFRYPDAPHDCEAFAVDTTTRSILLLTKRTKPPTLYSLPLGPANTGTDIAVAKHLLDITTIPAATPAERRALYPAARYAGQPTGMDIDPAAHRAIVLTYRNIWLFTRHTQQTWAQAFAQPPQKLPLPPIAQAEAIGFDIEGHSVFVSGERLPAPWIRFDPKP